MNHVNLLQARYGWTPNYQLVYKKPVPTGLKTFRVSQTSGIPGWIIFTYENDKPICVWASKNECKKVTCIVDERLCGDTFLKVERLSEFEYAVSDIWIYNSNCVFACSTFKQRYDWLKDLLSTFTQCIEGVTIDLIHKDDLDNVSIRGYEEHDDETIGKFGYFVEKDDSEILNIISLDIPDCYEIEGKKQYLRVPDIKTSLYLRSKGKKFTCRIKKFDEEFWSVVENIPELKVNVS